VGTEPRFFIRAAVNPFAQPLELELVVNCLKGKVTARAGFTQSQAIYNIEESKKWMGPVREEGLHKAVKILVGITPFATQPAFTIAPK